MSETATATRNFLVPADGTTHCVLTEFPASPGVPYNINWAQFSVDNFRFFPQGAFIDNSAGIAPLVINIGPVNYQITIPAGQRRIVQYPAPSQNQTASITGDGPVKIYWADFPTFPDNNANVTLAYTAANPLPVWIPPAFVVNVSVPATAPGGNAYQMDQRAFRPDTNTYNVACTAVASATIVVGAGTGTRARVSNAGPNAVAFRFDATAPVFPVAGANQPVQVILPGATEVFEVGAAGFSFRAICDAGNTATIYIEAGVGA